MLLHTLTSCCKENYPWRILFLCKCSETVLESVLQGRVYGTGASVCVLWRSEWFLWKETVEDKTVLKGVMLALNGVSWLINEHFTRLLPNLLWFFKVQLPKWASCKGFQRVRQPRSEFWLWTSFRVLAVTYARSNVVVCLIKELGRK